MPPDTLSGTSSDSTLGSSAAIDSLSAAHFTDRANLEAQQQAQVDQLTRSQNAAVAAVGKPGGTPAAPGPEGQPPPVSPGDSGTGPGGDTGSAGGSNSVGPDAGGSPGASTTGDTGESVGGP